MLCQEQGQTVLCCPEYVQKLVMLTISVESWRCVPRFQGSGVKRRPVNHLQHRKVCRCPKQPWILSHQSWLDSRSDGSSTNLHCELWSERVAVLRCLPNAVTLHVAWAVCGTDRRGTSDDPGMVRWVLPSLTNALPGRTSSTAAPKKSLIITIIDFETSDQYSGVSGAPCQMMRLSADGSSREFRGSRSSFA